MQRGLRRLAAEFAGERDHLPFNRTTFVLLRKLKAALSAGNIEVRRFEKAFLHAKAYIVTSANGSGNEGIIAGSSNLTGAGLNHNLELNIGRDDEAVSSSRPPMVRRPLGRSRTVRSRFGLRGYGTITARRGRYSFASCGNCMARRSKTTRGSTTTCRSPVSRNMEFARALRLIRGHGRGSSSPTKWDSARRSSLARFFRHMGAAVSVRC